MSINIDARGLACPEPVIATKKALASIVDGVVSIVVDNEVSKENVVKFATAHHCGVSVTRQGEDFSVRITKGAPGLEQAVLTQQAAVTGNTVYVITQDTLGHGSRELGAVLMKSFVYTLVETSPAPKSLVFMNSGVLLTVKDSPVVSHLMTLAENGVEILSCGTCLDYFGIKDKLAVGGITNMYTILETMSAAAKVITF